jgi:hypothetical protein
MPTGSITNLMADFCASADLYCNVDHLERIVSGAPVSGEVTDLATPAALGRGAWADVGALAREGLEPPTF